MKRRVQPKSWYPIGFMVFGCWISCSQPQPTPISASPEARFELGIGATWPADPFSDRDLRQLKENPVLRRLEAWERVRRITTPVETASGWAVPRFLTWYAKDDIQRLFTAVYTDLSPEERRRRISLSSALIQEYEAEHVQHVLNLDHWPQERLEAWRNSFQTPSGDPLPLRSHSLAGLSRSLYNGPAMKHLIQSYREVAFCADPPENAENWAPCLKGEFPVGSVIVKTSWIRRDFDLDVAVWDTSPEAMAHRLASRDTHWVLEGVSSPQDHDIFTMITDTGGRFQLQGLHFMTKEAREWFWVTLWWSPNPNSDFGSDRVPNLPPPWNHYKMCVSVDYQETADILDLPNSEIGEILEVLIRGNDGQSWCSNPYLERGIGNHKTNCIGCHQHGGSSISPEDILTDDIRFPHTGNSKVRTSFPSDYLWSTERFPEKLKNVFLMRIRHHDVYDPL